MPANKIYAVARGRATGLYMNWSDCEKQIAGYPGARYQAFETTSEALVWLGGFAAKPSPAQPNVPTKMPRPRTKKRTELPASAVPADVDYTIYTDGSCLRNPNGPGGWAIVAKNEATGEVKEESAGDPSTTNNRMELTAAIMALRLAPAGARVALYTDSQYLKNGITKWVAGWKRRGWKKADGQPVLNQPLWMELDRLYAAHTVFFHWVKGHAGNRLNERCDKLAKAAAMQYARR